MTDRQARKLIYAVIEANKNRFNDDTLEALEMGRTALEQEPKTGKWEFALYNWERCSICGYADKFADKWNYCPNCGAKMENVEKSLLDIKRENAE